MKKKLLLFGALLLSVSAARAQTTIVSGTVIDPNGWPYSGGVGPVSGRISGKILPPGVTSIRVGGKVFSTTFNAGLDINGHFSIPLVDNNLATPAGTQWQFTVCGYGALAPLGTGGQCFTAPPITITGIAQDISTQLNAVAKILLNVKTGFLAGCPGLTINKEVLFNDNGNCGGDPLLNYDKLAQIFSAPEVNVTGAGAGVAEFYDPGHINFVGFGAPPAVSVSYTMLAPPAIGAPNQVLQIDTVVGPVTQLKFGAGGTACPGATDKQILYSDAGVCAGDAFHTWDKTLKQDSIGPDPATLDPQLQGIFGVPPSLGVTKLANGAPAFGISVAVQSDSLAVGELVLSLATGNGSGAVGVASITYGPTDATNITQLVGAVHEVLIPGSGIVTQAEGSSVVIGTSGTSTLLSGIVYDATVLAGAGTTINRAIAFNAGDGSPAFFGSIGTAIGFNFAQRNLGFATAMVGVNTAMETQGALDYSLYIGQGKVGGGAGIFMRPDPVVVPIAPVVAPATAGATSWGYKIVPHVWNMHAEATAEGTTVLGSAVLNALDGNLVSWNPVTGASLVIAPQFSTTGWDVYRTTAGGVPNTTGFLFTVPGNQFTFFDDGTIAGAGEIPPTTNNTNSVATDTQFLGNLNFGPNGECYLLTGAGSPEGVVSAPSCSLYSSTTAGSNTTFYVKETSPTTNTGWIAFGAGGTIGGTVSSSFVPYACGVNTLCDTPFSYSLTGGTIPTFGSVAGSAGADDQWFLLTNAAQTSFLLMQINAGGALLVAADLILGTDVTLDPGGGINMRGIGIELNGAISGAARINVPAVAGSSTTLFLPTATATNAGDVLISSGPVGPINFNGSSLNDGGTGYAALDTFTVNTGSSLAAGVVDTVAVGVVLTYHLTSGGDGYATGTGVATTATSGVGTGLKLDISSVAQQLSWDAGIAKVTTAGKGFFNGYYVTPVFGTVTNIVPSGANAVDCFAFVLPFTLTVRNIGWSVWTNVGANTADFGIYDSTGTLLVHTGGADTNLTGNQTIASTAAVTLTPGVYFFAWASSSATYALVGPPGHLAGGILATQAGVFGTAANAATAGILPATLGAVTNNGNLVPPVVTFMP